jgi:hypothetical protein
MGSPQNGTVGFPQREDRRRGAFMGSTTKPKLKLIGKDGNAFSILGRAKRALQKAGRENEIEEYMEEATSGDYDHLLRVTMEWFEVE